MNTKLTIAAIGMFAVTLGIGLLSPAVAEKQGKILMCHWDEPILDEDGNELTPGSWIVISINGNAQSAHEGIHTDGIGNYDVVVDETFTNDGCTARNSA